LGKNYIFVITKINSMKKLVALVIVAGFLTACSQYTCPTYSKKEAPKKAASERKI
jgi:PBP1b-binding outer membrane lipoprotein LpoB